MMTLKELKGLVPKATVTSATPKAATLLKEDNSIVVKEVINGKCEIMVFDNGYVYYHADDKKTVFPLHDVDAYEFESVEKSCVLEGDFFDNENWYVRLILEGEDRIALNREKYHRKFTVSYSCESEDWDALKDQTEEVLEKLVMEDLLKETFGLIDEKSAEAIIDYYKNGYSHQQIAEKLNMKTNTVAQMICRGIQKLRKKAEIENGELILKKKKR